MNSDGGDACLIPRPTSPSQIRRRRCTLLASLLGPPYATALQGWLHCEEEEEEEDGTRLSERALYSYCVVTAMDLPESDVHLRFIGYLMSDEEGRPGRRGLPLLIA